MMPLYGVLPMDQLGALPFFTVDWGTLAPFLWAAVGLVGAIVAARTRRIRVSLRPRIAITRDRQVSRAA